jgi:hypothetical protein
MTKRRINRILYILLSVFVLCNTTSCYNLGNYKGGNGTDYGDYYDTFGDVVGIYPSVNSDNKIEEKSKSYDIEDSLFNKKINNAHSWDTEEYGLESHEYLYIDIPVEKEKNIDSMYLYIKGDKTVKMDIEAFYYGPSDSLPSPVKFYDSPESDDGGTISYGDPTSDKAISKSSVNVNNATFKSFGMRFSSKDGDGKNQRYFKFEENSHLYLKILNNSGFYKNQYERVSFYFIALLIHAI